MIGVDWGTSSLRGFRLGPRGVIEQREAARGIMTVPDRQFEPVLREFIGDWLDGGEDRILMSGMIGSRQGWVEAPYIPCPAGLGEIAAKLAPVTIPGARAFIVPGLSGADAQGVPEVMRGEETQILGLGAAEALICLPGSHSKWAIVAQGRIAGFTTYMTGEAFAALGAHTILARSIAKAPIAPEDFGRGLDRAAEPGGLLHHLFGVRTLGLTGALSNEGARSYLSGLLIGHEARAALAAHPGGGAVRLLGDPALCDLYATAIRRCGGEAAIESGAAAAAGLMRIGELVSWN